MTSMKPPGAFRAPRGRPKRTRPENEDDMEHASPVTRPKRLGSRNCGGRQNQGGSSDRMCTTSKSNTGTLSNPKVNGDFVGDVGCTTSSQPRQFLEPPQKLSYSGSSESNHDRDQLLQWIQHIIVHRKSRSRDKLFRLQNGLNEFLEVQDGLHNDEISKLKNEIDTLKHEHVFDIAQWKHECHSMQEERLVDVQKDKEARQKNNEELNLKLKLVGINFMAGMQHFNECRKALEPTETCIHEVNHGCSNHLQPQIKGDSPELTREMQKSSHKHGAKSSKKVKPGLKNGEEKLNVSSGSYADGSALPSLLQIALSTARGSVKRFQTVLLEGLKSKHVEPIQVEPGGLLNPDVFLARPNHLALFVKSAVNARFFEGFEDESFGLRIRSQAEMNYEYYLHQREQNIARDDPRFEEFCRTKHSLLWKMVEKMFPECSCLEELDVPELVSTFRVAAKKVWLLHKLAFSFEPPASILTVKVGDDLDPKYMKAFDDNLEGCERFDSKVGFMISPGLCVRNIFMPCEVYLAGATTTPEWYKTD